MDKYFDLFPQEFYLLSAKNRRLFKYKTNDHVLEQAIEDMFTQLGGANIFAKYKYNSQVATAVDCITNRFKKQYPSIQQLRSYFKNFADGDFFIRHRACAPFVDIKRSIITVRAIERGYDPKVEETHFILHWGRLYLKYEVISCGYLSKSEFVGEPDKSKRICRFCNKSGEDRFRKIAHSIMDALGNKLLFCNEECDECNQRFEKDIERHLYKFLEISRTLANVKGKNSKHHHLEGRNFCIHPNELTGKPTVYIKNTSIINDKFNGKPSGKLLIFNTGLISFQGIFRALVKIAIDMIPSEKFKHFRKTAQWVRGDFNQEQLPSFLYGEQYSYFFEQPELDLFFKNAHSPVYSPYCTAILYVFNSIFIYTIPLNDIDKDMFTCKADLQRHWDFFKKYQYLMVHDWEEFDASDSTDKTPYYKISIIDSRYDIVFRENSDKVFESQKRK